MSSRTRRWWQVVMLAAVLAATLAWTFPMAAEAATSASAGDGGTTTVAAGYHLLGYLPPNVQHTCSLGRPGDAQRTQAVARQVTAELFCYPQDGLNVTFVQLSSAAALDRLYTSYLGSDFHPQLFDASASCESQGTWSSNGVNAGREACYRNGTTSAASVVAIVWTYDQANIFGIAYRNDGNADSLRSWWDGAGPRPYSSPAVALPTPGENVKANKALLQRFPTQVTSQSRCTPVNLASVSALGDQVDWRLWLAGAVDCMAHGLPVADVTYVQWTDSAALAAYLRFVAGNVSIPPNQAAGCISGTYDVQGQPTGAYVCTSARGDTTNRTRGLIAVVAWSNSQLGIGAFAARNDNNTAALMRWWHSDASGPVLSGATPPTVSTPTSAPPANAPKGSTCPPTCY